MPIKRKGYSCQFCGECALTYALSLIHESYCEHNPKLKGCSSCKHLDLDPPSSYPFGGSPECKANCKEFNSDEIGEVDETKNCSDWK